MLLQVLVCWDNFNLLFEANGFNDDKIADLEVIDIIGTGQPVWTFDAPDMIVSAAKNADVFSAIAWEESTYKSTGNWKVHYKV